MPPDLVERVRAFMASDPSPEQIEALATQLEGAGLPDAARQLREVAASRRRQQQQSPAPSTPAPSAPAPSAPAPSTPAPSTPGPSAPGPSSPAGSATRTPGTSSSSATDSDSSSRPGGSGAPQSGRQLAAQTAQALAERYARIQQLTREFQRAAEITVDGVYGPVTRAALTYWSGRPAPRHWAGSGRMVYEADARRGDGSAFALRAERAARRLFLALVAPEGPAKELLEQFQRAAGLRVDGKYGRRSRAALQRLGVASPPPRFRRSRRRGSSPRRSG